MAVIVYIPTSETRDVLKFGFSGYDVQACQATLDASPVKPGLVEDGSYGPKTQAAVVALQKLLGITKDGVLGPVTQAALCARECKLAEVHVTPPGLLIGLCLGESGGLWAETTPRYKDGSRDFFAFQRNLTNPTQAERRAVADIYGMALDSAVKLATKQRLYANLGSPSEQVAWKLAVLSYNWPVAAQALAEGRRATWEYQEVKDGPYYHLDDPTPWVEAWKIPGVTTGWDWCQHYIKTKVGSVTSWTV